MSFLDLQMEVPTDAFDLKLFPILRDYLQSDTAMTLESTVNSILDLLPENSPNSTDVWSFGELCIELVEQIPYHHPSQLKLAGLLEYIGKSTKLGQIVVLEVEGMNWSQFHRFQRLKESLRDSFMAPDPDFPSRYVNFHAFLANLGERRILPTRPTWAIWALRDAHEEPREEHGSIGDAYILGSAQYILWYGQSLFKQILYPGDAPTDELRGWRPGPLYDGKKVLSLHRWHFWRDSFNAVASQDKEAENQYGQECQMVAAKAADMMDSLEKNMTF